MWSYYITRWKDTHLREGKRFEEACVLPGEQERMMGESKGIGTAVSDEIQAGLQQAHSIFHILFIVYHREAGKRTDWLPLIIPHHAASCQMPYLRYNIIRTHHFVIFLVKVFARETKP
jgi:hypothetical protein